MPPSVLSSASPFAPLAPPANALLQAIFASSDDAIVSITLDGIITSWNPAAERLFGYPPDEIVGGSLLKLIPLELHHEQHRILERLRRGERIEHFESRRQRKDGALLFVALTISPVIDETTGEIIGASEMARDVTHDRLMRNARAWLAAIVDSSDDAIISKDLNGIVTSWNRAAERIFGYKADEIVGRSVLALIPPELHSDEPIILSRLRVGDRIEHFETVRVRKNGERIAVSLTVSPIRDVSGSIVGASKVVRDISVQRDAEVIRRRLAAIVDSSDDAIISKDLSGVIQSWNKAAEQMFGYTADEVIGKSVTLLMPPEQAKEEPMILARLARGERIHHHETIRRRKNGELIDVSLTISAIRDETGRVVGASKIARDVTQQKRDERERILLLRKEKEARARLDFSLSALELGDWTWDAATDRMTISDRTADIYGLPHGVDRRRETLRELIHPDDRAAAQAAAEHSIQSGTDYDIEYRINHPTGERWVVVKGRPQFGPGGEIVGMMGVVQDITERKSVEIELRESRAKLQSHAAVLEQHVAERTAKLRETIGELEAFSYSISHDMRTPLRAMHGYADRLLRIYGSKLDDEAQHHLQRISANANRLDLLVRDVLAYSRVAKADIQLAPIDLNPFLAELLPTIPELQREGVTLNVHGPLPTVIGHQAYLSQIFSNLIGNAVKFSAENRPAHVNIRASQDTGHATITVSDNGIGIAPEHFNRIFEIFGRVYADKKYEGTGIGLSIVKKAVQRMGGQISVTSTVGEGSCFSFTLRTA